MCSYTVFNLPTLVQFFTLNILNSAVNTTVSTLRTSFVFHQCSELFSSHIFGFHRDVAEVFALLRYFRGLDWQLVTEVSGQYIGTVFKSAWNDATVSNWQPTQCSIATDRRSLFQSFVWPLILLYGALELFLVQF